MQAPEVVCIAGGISAGCGAAGKPFLIPDCPVIHNILLNHSKHGTYPHLFGTMFGFT